MSFYKGCQSTFSFAMPCVTSELQSAQVVFRQLNQTICTLAQYTIENDTIQFEMGTNDANKFSAYDRDLNERDVEYQFQFSWKPTGTNTIYNGSYPIQHTKCKKKL